MKKAIGLALVVLLLGGCVAYIGPYEGRPGAGAYGGPGGHSRWGWRGD
jgi:hypothetical protein